MKKRALYFIFMLIPAMAEVFDVNSTSQPLNIEVKEDWQHVGDSNSSDPRRYYNPKNIINDFDLKNAGKYLPGNAQMMLGKGSDQFSKSVQAAVSGRNSAENYKTKNLKDKGFSNIETFDSERENVINSSLSNNYATPPNKNRNLKCYISRDIPIAYQCTLPENSLIYGSTIGVVSSVYKAKKQCESECFRQFSCTNINPNAKIEYTEDINKTIDYSSLPLVIEIDADPDKKTDELIFSEDHNCTITFSIGVVSKNNSSYELVKNMISTKGNSKQSLFIGDYVQKVILKIDKKEGLEKDKIKIGGLKIKYKPNYKYICPIIQDRTDWHDYSSFGIVCPVPMVEVEGENGTKYKICPAPPFIGDNPDGTFSDKEICDGTCREKGDCRTVLTLPSETVLQNVKEGCLPGNAGCTIDECKNARISKSSKVLNEWVIFADGSKVQTVASGTVLNPELRPRIAIDQEMDFQERLKEEWKDSAYLRMIKNGTFDATGNIEENTKPSFAYRMQIEGVGYGALNKIERKLLGLIKPAAHDVYSGKSIYLYAILLVDLIYPAYDQEGNVVTKTDQVWYLKTSKNDTFKPIRRYIDYAKTDYKNIDDVYYTPQIVINQYSSPKNETFNTMSNSWGTYPVSAYADYWMRYRFDAEKYFWEFSVIDRILSLENTLPGVIKRVVTDSTTRQTTYYYSGNRDETGQGISKLKVYLAYSQKPLKYNEILDSIEKLQKGERLEKSDFYIGAIYETGNERMFKTTPDDDSIKKNSGGADIKIYKYGKPQNTTVFTLIKPNKNDVGKKGFIYVFIQ